MDEVDCVEGGGDGEGGDGCWWGEGERGEEGEYAG